MATDMDNLVLKGIYRKTHVGKVAFIQQIAWGEYCDILPSVDIHVVM